MKVTISSLNTETGEDEVDGTIAWAGGPLIFDPPDDPGLRALQDVGVEDPAGGGTLTAQANPGAWLANLYTALSSAYLRASQPHA